MRCAHDPCTCMVTEEGGFCSPACAEAGPGGGMDSACNCPHDSCGAPV